MKKENHAENNTFALLGKLIIAAAAIYGAYQAGKALRKTGEALCEKCRCLLHRRKREPDEAEQTDSQDAAE